MTEEKNKNDTQRQYIRWLTLGTALSFIAVFLFCLLETKGQVPVSMYFLFFVVFSVLAGMGSRVDFISVLTEYMTSKTEEEKRKAETLFSVNR